MTEEKTPRSQPTKAQRDTGIAVRSSGDPASMFDELFRQFDELFQPMSTLSGRLRFPELETIRQPILEVQDRGDHYGLTAELPGFTKDEVEVKVTGNGIELKAAKTEKGDDEKGFTSGRSRSYYQYLSLPEDVVAEKIDGTMNNGILELELPKKPSTLRDSWRRVDLK